jgi:hypothetical protein
VAKRISILGLRDVNGFWQGSALLDGSDTMLTSDLDPAVYSEDTARETFIHVFNVVSERASYIRDVVARSLVETYNARWRQGRTAALTPAALAKKLTFERVHCSEPDHPSRLISISIGGPEVIGRHRLGCLLGWDGGPLFAPAIAT